MPVIERSDGARQGSAEAAAGGVDAAAPGGSARVGRRAGTGAVKIGLVHRGRMRGADCLTGAAQALKA